MKTKFMKRLGSIVLAAAITVSGLAYDVTPVSAAEKGNKVEFTTASTNSKTSLQKVGEDAEVLFGPESGSLSASDTYSSINFEVAESTGVEVYVYTDNASVTLDCGTSYNYDEYACTIDYKTIKPSAWEYDSSVGMYGAVVTFGSSYKPGLYCFDFRTDTSANFAFVGYSARCLSKSKLTLTAGFSDTLKVVGGKAKSWKSSKTSVATVKNGKVTAKKAGSATITCTLTDGSKVTCKVTVKKNQYSESKLSRNDFYSEDIGSQIYKASYDSKGNLVLKVRIVNNTYHDMSKAKFKYTLKNAKGKKIGTYSATKSIKIGAYSTKETTLTIKKSSLKIKKADLRTMKYTSDSVFYYYY